MVSDEEIKKRQALVDVMLAMDASGLNTNTAGNASLRHGDRVLITPSGIPATDLTPGDIVLIDFDGHHSSHRKPSSEWRMHADLLAKRHDVNAVVHCHSRFATILACAHREIPPMHYMTAVSGHMTVPLAPYATFGTPELADAIISTLRDGYACLMANHGQIAVASSLKEALAIAAEIEVQASYYFGTLTIGGPVLLSDKNMEDVVDRFKSYGQK
jgi:L-fuculose-phosphate aldolase